MKKKKRVIQPEGNFYNKYGSQNPIIKKLMNGFFKSLEELIDEVPFCPPCILEAGCGEGHVTTFLNHKFNSKSSIDAFDISEKVIEEAKRQNNNITFWVGDIYHISQVSQKQYDLLVCSEVLEHLEEPKRALEELLKVSRGYLILSVPREPIWRFLNMIRGKYISDLGNTPGHIQHWSTIKFKRFIEENDCNIIRIKNPLPWTMILIKKNPRGTEM